jgi:predicted TPR repeat methyltransferase
MENPDAQDDPPLSPPQVPWQLYDALQAVRPAGSCGGRWHVIDLGCGTGLCGGIFREYSANKEPGEDG